MTISFSRRLQEPCAECGAERVADAWLIVDAQERPDLWEYARLGTLHQAQCRNGHRVYLGLALLLHDGVAQVTLLVPFSARLGRYPTQQDLPTVQDEVQQQGQSLLSRVDQALPPDAPRGYLQLTRIVPSDELAGAMASLAPAAVDGAAGLRAQAAMLAQIDRPWDAADMPARIALIRSCLQAAEASSDRPWQAMLQWRLGTSFGQSSAGDADENTESAIEALQAAAGLLDPEGDAGARADVQLNLSTMYLRRSSPDLAGDLQAAITAAEAGLACLPEAASPDRWALGRRNIDEARRQLDVEAAHPGLMVAGRRLARRDPGRPAFVAEAAPTGRMKEVLSRLAALQAPGDRGERIVLLDEAVALTDVDTDPKRWAMFQLALGNECVGSDDAAEFTRGLAAMGLARERFDPFRDTAEWTATCLNASAAWFNRRTGDRDDNLLQSITLLREALDQGAVSRGQESHAKLSYNLGQAWLERPGGDPAINLESGVAALRDAQQTWTRATHPTQWVDVQVQIGQGCLDGRTADLPARLEQAIEAFEAALGVCSRTHTPEAWARVQHRLGYLYGHRLQVQDDIGRDYERAIQALDLARTVYTRSGAPMRWAAVTVDLAWPYRYRVQGDAADNRERSLEAVQEALTVLEPAGDSQRLASARQELGVAYVERLSGDAPDNLRRAQAALESAQALRPRDSQPLAWAALEAEIGVVHLKAGRTEAALASHEAAVGLYEAHRERLDIADRINLGSFYLNLAQLYRHRDTEDAAADWQRRLACLTRAGEWIPRVTYPGRWANLQGLLMRAYQECPTGDRAENLRLAIAHGRSALDVQPADSADRESSRLAFELAGACAEQGAWDEVQALLGPALAAADRIYTAEVTEASRAETLARNRDAYALMIKACLQLNRDRPATVEPPQGDRPAPQRLRDAFLHAEAGRSRLLRDQLGALSLPPPTGVPASILQMESALLAEIRRLQTPALRPGEATLDRTSLERLRVVRDQLEGLWEEMRHRFHADEHVSLRQGERIEWTAVSAWLAAQGPGIGVLEFYGIDDHYIAFVLRAGMAEPVVVEFDSPLATQADGFVESLGRRQFEQRSEADERGIGPRPLGKKTSLAGALESLGRAVLAPLMPHLEGLELLYLVPYGRLHRLPLHALAWEGEPLIARMAVAYAPSVAVAMRMSTRAAPIDTADGAAPLIIGDPAGDLPFARSEAVGVAGLLQVTPLLGPQADKAAVLAGLAVASRAHFASHACFDPDDPFASGLLLADGVLSARELAGQATPVRLMVLSACETGVQQLRPGDELVGLARALSYAGVASLVLTLWRVDDRATEALMLSFYRHRAGGAASSTSIAHALRAAVLETRQAVPEPYAWAAFTVFGDWR